MFGRKLGFRLKVRGGQRFHDRKPDRLVKRLTHHHERELARRELRSRVDEALEELVEDANEEFDQDAALRECIEYDRYEAAYDDDYDYVSPEYPGDAWVDPEYDYSFDPNFDPEDFTPEDRRAWLLDDDDPRRPDAPWRRERQERRVRDAVTESVVRSLWDEDRVFQTNDGRLCYDGGDRLVGRRFFEELIDKVAAKRRESRGT